jgi:uncharacterized membrane protein YcaP (DUF421 family)
VENLGVIGFDVLAIMAVMLVVSLAMGQRQLGELSPLDFAVSITAGTVAGAGIADPRIELGHTIVALVLLGVLQVGMSWLTLKFRFMHRKLSPQPTVVVENGRIIKANLRKVRMPAEMLLQLLREKGVFDITEVELAILEPQGKLSVLKQAEYAPLTPRRLNVDVPPNKILVPVILEGQLQEAILEKMGFSKRQIETFRQQHDDKLHDVFIAFMDKDQQLHIIKEDVRESGIFMH